MIVNILNLPRSLKTTADMSAPLRQGAILIPTHPKISADAFVGMFKDAFSEKSFNKYLDDLYNSPNYRELKDSGLFVADPRKVAPGLTGREEQFMSNLLENLADVKVDSPQLNKLLGIVRLPGEIGKASSRASSSFLIRQRVGVFQDLAASFNAEGTATPETIKALANFVNAASGRGSLGSLEKNTKLLSSTFFSPKFNFRDSLGGSVGRPKELLFFDNKSEAAEELFLLVYVWTPAPKKTAGAARAPVKPYSEIASLMS